MSSGNAHKSKIWVIAGSIMSAVAFMVIVSNLLTMYAIPGQCPEGSACPELDISMQILKAAFIGGAAGIVIAILGLIKGRR